MAEDLRKHLTEEHGQDEEQVVQISEEDLREWDYAHELYHRLRNG